MEQNKKRVAENLQTNQEIKKEQTEAIEGNLQEDEGTEDEVQSIINNKLPNYSSLNLYQMELLYKLKVLGIILDILYSSTMSYPSPEIKFYIVVNTIVWFFISA